MSAQQARTGTAAIVMAAGASTRLGHAKQLVVFAGEPLLVRAVRLAAEAGCRPVMVVLGARAEEIAAAVEGHAGWPEGHAGWPGSRVQMVRNEEWPEGMASSIRCGIEALRMPHAGDGDVTGCVIMTCDQPFITAGHLAALSQSVSGEACATAFAGRKGVPAYFPASDFTGLLALRGEAGARSLLHDAEAIHCADAAFDVDERADVERLRMRMRAEK